MTTRFQAAVGPSMERCHIYVVGTDPKMSLCNAVCCARDYKADLTLSNSRMCGRCMTKFWKIWNADETLRQWDDDIAAYVIRSPRAADFGVSSLEF